MSNYEELKNRLTFEEARLSTLTTEVTATRARVKKLKTELAKAEPEAVKANKKDSEKYELIEVRDEGDQEALLLTDGQGSKIVTVKK